MLQLFLVVLYFEIGGLFNFVLASHYCTPFIEYFLLLLDREVALLNGWRLVVDLYRSNMEING